MTVSYIKNPDLISAGMSGDTVMMSVDNGKYYGITGVGSRIWSLLGAPATVDSIVQAICAEYEIDEAACQADVEVFLSDLLKDNLVSIT